jgi:hypothetical protein
MARCEKDGLLVSVVGEFSRQRVRRRAIVIDWNAGWRRFWASKALDGQSIGWMALGEIRRPVVIHLARKTVHRIIGVRRCDDSRAWMLLHVFQSFDRWPPGAPSDPVSASVV